MLIRRKTEEEEEQRQGGKKNQAIEKTIKRNKIHERKK